MPAYAIYFASRVVLAMGLAAGPPAALGEQASRAPDVYVNDSLEADDQFAKARRFAEQDDWSRAALLVDDCLANHADKVITVAPGSYRSLSDVLGEFVASWPSEGIQSYKAQFESSARLRFEQARQTNDLGGLLACAQRYFCTSSGLAAAETAAELALESANFALARRQLDRLATTHPDRSRHIERLRAKIAVTDALAEAATARPSTATAAPIDRIPASTTVTWKGEDRALAAILEEIRSSFTGRPAPDPSTHWPIFFGAADRAQVARFAGDRLAELWRLEEFGQNKPSVLSMFERSIDLRSRRSGTDLGRMLAMNPVYADGMVYIQDAQHVWAVRAETGRLEWSYGEKPREGSAESGDSAVAPWYGATVKDGRVFACLGSSLAPYYGYEQAERAASVAALDAATGRIAWKYVGPAEDSQFSEFTYDPSPIVADGMVFVIERRRRAFGFEDCALLRMDARTGDVLSRTHLAGASTGGFGYRRPTVSFAALADDTVYVCTNLGAVAAVSAQSGLIRWLRVYNRDPSGDGRSASGNSAWRYNPVVASGGRIFALPTDVDRLLVMDADSGRMEREIRTTVLGKAESLYGVIDGRVYGVGVEAFAYDLTGDRVLWLRPLPEDEQLLGRGVLTADGLLVPTSRALCRFDLADGSRRDHPFTGPGNGGNVIVAGDRLIIAGATHLAAYANKEMVWQRLRSRMAERPTDPAPALDFAEIAFRSGDVDESLDALADAVRRAGGFATPIDPELRRRIFEDCMSFAASLDSGVTLDADRAAPIIRLYEFAAQCPPDRVSHVRYRVRLADVCARSDDAVRAANLYQQVIADQSLRDERIADLTHEADQPVGEFCEQRIAALIESAGRDVYSRHDQDAEQLLAASRAAGDVDGLNRVATQFPNSLAASRATIAAGDLLRDRGRHIAAARAYRSALERHDSDAAAPDRIELMVRLATAFKLAERNEAALGYLSAAAEFAPRRRMTFDGREGPLAEHLPRLQSQLKGGWRRLPQLTASPSEHDERGYPESVTLLAPNLQATTDWSRYFVYSDAAVQAFQARTHAPVWESAAPCRMQPRLLAATPSRVVLATRHQVLALDAADGRKVWSEGVYPADLGDVLADHENFSMFRYHAVAADRLLAAQDGGQAVCLDMESGRRIWSAALADAPIGRPVLGFRFAAYPAVVDGRSVVCVLDADTGNLRHRLSTDEDSQIIWLEVTADDRLLVASAGALHGFDPDTGERLWRRTFDSPIAASGIRIGLDGLYLATGGYVEKLRLADGRPAWRSDALTVRPDPAFRLELVGRRVLVVADGLLIGLDAANGRAAIEPTDAPDSPEHVYLTSHSSVAILTSGHDADEPMRWVVYDLADGIHVAPRFDQQLGRLEDVRRVVVCDEAVVIQDGQTIHGWSGAN